jgi:hypothetical protein
MGLEGRSMLGELVQVLEAGFLMAILTVSVGIFLYRRFSELKLSRERWMARLPLAWMMVRRQSARRAVRRAVSLGVVGLVVMWATTQDLGRSLQLCAAYIVFGGLTFVALEVLKAADLEQNAFEGQLRAARAAQDARKAGGRR